MIGWKPVFVYPAVFLCKYAVKNIETLWKGCRISASIYERGRKFPFLAKFINGHQAEVVPPVELPRSNIFFVRLAQSPLSVSQNTYIEIADPSANSIKTYVVTSLFPIPLNAAAYSSPERIMWRGMPVSIDDFENAEFNYSSIATYQTDISVNYKSVNCDNTMRIKLRGGVENSFSMSTYILETYIKALNGRNGGGNGYYSDQIAGHMRSV